MKIIVDEKKDVVDSMGVCLVYNNKKTDEIEVSCDDILDSDEIVCKCGRSFGTLKELIYPKINQGSFMQTIKCGDCGTVRRFFFWTYSIIGGYDDR